jgi:diguanylate cyclase (GGDEF)-like protein
MAHSWGATLVPAATLPVRSFIVPKRPQYVTFWLVAGTGVVAVASTTRRWPTGTTLVVAVTALAAVGFGLTRKRLFQPPGWRKAWTGLGLGLMGVAGATVWGVLFRGAIPTRLGVPMALTIGGDLLAIAGLAWLLDQRVPGRASEALAESVVGTLSLAFALLTLAVVPADGWKPGLEVGALAVPLLDIAVLWVACSLVSLTERHPIGYRYLIAGVSCVLVAHALFAAEALTHRTGLSRTLETVVLAGVCLWGAAFAHPSLRRPFDPVPLRPTRPGGIKVVLLVAMALVVPAVLTIQSALGITTRQPVLVVGSTLLPLLMVLYLLRQVFTHAAAEYRAQHDPLTGVCNRLLFEDRLRLSLAQAERTGCSVTVMFLDLDRFKGINDSLGHAVGNQLLQAVVRRLQSSLREQDTLARFGGDEFTIIIPDSDGRDESLATVAERILNRFADPFNVGNRQLTVKASIGLAASPRDGADVETLLKHADTAMYQAKAAGKNTFQIFDSAMSARARLRFALEDGLRAAVECGRLAVHYQPKLDVATGTITGIEALARWQHPRLGFIPPWAFIPLAEESSLVATLGEWVLDVACTQARRWQDQGLPAVPVAVNLSPRQFAHQQVVETVTEVLRRSRLDPALLELEVTESVLMDHMGTVAESLNELRAMGLRCSIDDFGTGYSALTYLAKMPVDAIKIDRSFVQAIDEEGGGSEPIVGAVIALAHSLRLEVVAEGVETDAQLHFLESHGCDQVQGYRFSPPVAAAEMATLLRNPERLFTDWREELASRPVPISVVAPARFEALLDSVLQEGRWPTDVDMEVIEAVLAELQPDDLRYERKLRVRRPRSARLALGTLAGVATVAGGVASENIVPGTIHAISDVGGAERTGTRPGHPANDATTSDDNATSDLYRSERPPA